MTLGVLQARTASTRLPNKVLLPILGRPMLARQIERIQRATSLERLIVATSRSASDDAIERMCATVDIECFRGSEDDVLDRFYQAAHAFGAPTFMVRLTGDCPLTDPAIIDAVVRTLVDRDLDYVSSALVPTYPDGLDVEAIRFTALEEAWRQAHLPSEREHVTQFLLNHPERFRIGDVRGASDLSSLRWTVDEPEDFELVTQIYEQLYPTKPDFSTEDIVRLLDERPALRELNARFARNEGLARSRAADRARRPVGDR